VVRRKRDGGGGAKGLLTASTDKGHALILTRWRTLDEVHNGVGWYLHSPPTGQSACGGLSLQLNTGIKPFMDPASPETSVALRRYWRTSSLPQFRRLPSTFLNRQKCADV